MKVSLRRRIKIGDILGLHADVVQLAQAVVDSQHGMALQHLSQKSLQCLLHLHPIQLAPVNQQNKFVVVAGLRSYQAAVVGLKSAHSVPALVYQQLSQDQIRALVAADLIGSPALISLGTKPQQQFERLCGHVGNDLANSVNPELSSARGIRRLLRGSA